MMTTQRKLDRRHLNSELRGAVASLAIMLMTLLLAAPALHADDYCAPGPAPGSGTLIRPGSPELPMAAQLSISNAVGSDQKAYHATLRNGSARMANPDTALSAQFTSKLVEFQVGGDRWGMALSAVGYGASLRPVSQAAPKTSANRVEYRRGPLTEWYLNGPLGIEQGFTIQQRPGAASNGAPLTLAFKLSGNMAPSIDAGRRGITLASNGSPVFHYRDLVVSDAGGRELQAWLETSGNELRIRVDDAGATYPLVVDPVAFAEKLTSCEPASSAEFGMSVALSGDGHTAVALTNSAAYVFQEGTCKTCGWGDGTIKYAVAKLVPSVTSSVTNSVFGLAVSDDGSTIAILGEKRVTIDHVDGVVWVFVRPGASWSSSTVLNQTATLTVFNTDRQGVRPAISADGGTIAAAFKVRTDPAIPITGDSIVNVFTKPAGGWADSSTPAAELTASNEPGAPIQSVAISGDGNTIAAGATRHVTTSTFEGAVYLYLKPSGGWTATTQHEAAQLTASQNDSVGSFGHSLALSNDGGILVTSAPGDGTGGGSAYLFQKPSSGWPSSATENAKFTQSDAGSSESFGWDVDVDHDGYNVVVSNRTYAANGGPGSLYYFARPASGWASSTETQKITGSDVTQPDDFGASISMSNSGTLTAVGAPLQDAGTYTQSGAVYIFAGRSGTPTASVSPSSLTFGNQTIGTTSSTQTVTLENTGNAPLTVSSVAASSQFTTTTHCVKTLNQGDSCTEDVAFAPTASGAVTGTLTFTDNSGGTSGTTQQVQLSGTGVKAGTATAITSVSPSPALVGENVTVTFSVTSASGSSFTPSGTVTVTATGASCTATLPATSCQLAFSTVGTKTITASYSGDAHFEGSTSSSVSLIVRNFTMYVSPGSKTIASGKSGSYNVAVVGANGFTGTVSLSCSGGPGGTTCTMSPASVNLSASTTAAGSSATVNVPAGAATGTFVMTFTGTFGSNTRTATATLVVKK